MFCNKIKEKCLRNWQKNQKISFLPEHEISESSQMNFITLKWMCKRTKLWFLHQMTFGGKNNNFHRNKSKLNSLVLAIASLQESDSSQMKAHVAESCTTLWEIMGCCWWDAPPSLYSPGGNLLHYDEELKQKSGKYSMKVFQAFPKKACKVWTAAYVTFKQAPVPLELGAVLEEAILVRSNILPEQTRGANWYRCELVVWRLKVSVSNPTSAPVMTEFEPPIVKQAGNGEMENY